MTSTNSKIGCFEGTYKSKKGCFEGCFWDALVKKGVFEVDPDLRLFYINLFLSIGLFYFCFFLFFLIFFQSFLSLTIFYSPHCLALSFPLFKLGLRLYHQTLIVSLHDCRKESADIINNPISLTAPQPAQSATTTSSNSLVAASNTVESFVAFLGGCYEFIRDFRLQSVRIEFTRNYINRTIKWNWSDISSNIKFRVNK